MQFLGIDCLTDNATALVRRLRQLKTTIRVRYHGPYWVDVKYSQIHLQTEWTEAQLDDWLYRTKGVEAVGTFPLDPRWAADLMEEPSVH